MIHVKDSSDLNTNACMFKSHITAVIFFLSLFSEMVDAARKALISRVEELTNERSTLNLELTSCQETINRLEGKTKEMEEETKRFCVLLDLFLFSSSETEFLFL